MFTALGGAALFAATGCRPPDIPHSFFFPLARRDAAVNISQRLVVLADTQVHYLFGSPVAIRNELVDSISPGTQVAVRPVQLDLFGLSLMRHITRKAGPYVYLGDAADLSCKQELRAVMSQFKGKKWVFAPGNHDGYFFGHRHLNDRADWARACGGDDGQLGPLNKAELVEMYLSALAADNGHDPASKSFEGFVASIRKEGRLPPDREWTYDDSTPPDPARPAEKPFLRAVAWHIDREKPWRSFVVQKIDWTDSSSAEQVVGIILDTSEYAWQPSLVPGRIPIFMPVLTGENAGMTGEISEAQHAIADRWARELRSKGALVTLFGHHQYDVLTPPARKRFDDLRKEHDIPVYVSAHTHEGFWRIHDDGPRPWVEVNVGSTSDWPPQSRNVTLRRLDGRLMVSSPLFRLDDMLRRPQATLEEGGLKCELDWEAKPTDPAYDDFYLTYMDYLSPSPDETQNHVLNAVLRAERRLFQYVPTDDTCPCEDRPPCSKDVNGKPVACPDDVAIVRAIDALLRGGTVTEKTEFLQRLIAFDGTRTPQSWDTSDRYRMCQAIWASKYEHLRSRQMDLEDEAIVLPWR